ncbi:MAG: hypothetical protein ABSC05_12655 [Candidatus Solibacter sp.]|jgi:hypothetical protein
MPDISFTDELGKPVETVQIDLSQPSSLVAYARSQVLHLLVAPDFVALQDQALSAAAPKPIQFQATLGNDFQLGASTPAITLTPKVHAVLHADAAHAGLEVTGSLAPGVSVAAGDFTFGMNAASSVTIGFDKAFAGAAPEPSLGGAVGQMLSAFVIPASVADLRLLHPGDVCAVSGEGSLKLTAGFDVAAPVNPLASVNLPLNAGSIDVKDGLMAGVSASVTLSGGYQIRAEGLAGGAVGLRFQKQKGLTLRGDLTASASASVQVGGADLLAALVGAIAKTDPDPKLLAGLSEAETQTFNAALKDGVDHALQVSLDLALSTTTEDDALFEYEIQPGALDAISTSAVNRALHGDLTALTGLESPAGVTLRSSILTRMRSHGVTLKVNLLGIVNLISMSNLIGKCEILSDPASGGVTIKETAASQRIGAITNAADRQEALRKAIFESVLATTTYRASGVVAMPELHCANLHFVADGDTSAAKVRDYLNWFVALNLMARGDVAAALSGYTGDKTSTCLLRTELDDAACENLFFAGGTPRQETYYREYGRDALRALLDPGADEIASARYRFLDDPATWARAVEIGPSPELRQLIPLDSTDPRFDQVLADVTGDLYDIVWWAESMTQAGTVLLEMRQFLNGRDPVGLKDDAEFQQKREALQQLMLKVVAKSKARFGEPWGMVSLFWSAGSPKGAMGRVQAGNWSVSMP